MEEVLKEVEAMGAALMLMKDVELITGESMSKPEIKNAYLKGVKTTQYKLNKVIVDQAIAGSKPAQDMVNSLLDTINMNDGI